MKAIDGDGVCEAFMVVIKVCNSVWKVVLGTLVIHSLIASSIVTKSGFTFYRLGSPPEIAGSALKSEVFQP